MQYRVTVTLYRTAAVQYGVTLQYSTVQYRMTVQYSTVLYRVTVQYRVRVPSDHW